MENKQTVWVVFEGIDSVSSHRYCRGLFSSLEKADLYVLKEARYIIDPKNIYVRKEEFDEDGLKTIEYYWADLSKEDVSDFYKDDPDFVIVEMVVQ